MIASNKKITKLEALRGFAAVYVVLHHLFAKGLIIFGRDISFLFKLGQEAVILFFLLSGFVIQYAYVNSKDKSFKAFFIKRALRIYIPLLIVFATNILLVYFNGYKFSLQDFYVFVGNIFMLQDVPSLKPNVICGPFLGNLPLWSLSYEWWFYLIFFFFYNKFGNKASNYIYITGTLSALTYIFFPNFVNRELMYLIIWWIGADLAMIHLKNESYNIKHLKVPLFYLLANIAVLFINVKLNNKNATIGISPYLEFRHFVFALLVLALAFTWKRFNWIGFKQTIGLFEVIAPISFGLYISHWFMIIDAHYLDRLIANHSIRAIGYIIIGLGYAYVVERVLYVWISSWVIKRTLGTGKPKANTNILQPRA